MDKQLCVCRCVVWDTPNRASSGQFPEHQAERVDVRSLERFKVAHIDRLVQNFGGHVPAEDKMIKV